MHDFTWLPSFDVSVKRKKRNLRFGWSEITLLVKIRGEGGFIEYVEKYNDKWNGEQTVLET